MKSPHKHIFAHRSSLSGYNTPKARAKSYVNSTTAKLGNNYCTKSTDSKNGEFISPISIKPCSSKTKFPPPGEPDKRRWTKSNNLLNITPVKASDLNPNQTSTFKVGKGSDKKDIRKVALPSKRFNRTSRLSTLSKSGSMVKIRPFP